MNPNLAHTPASQADCHLAIRSLFGSQRQPASASASSHRSASNTIAHRLALSLSESHPLPQNITTAFTVYDERRQADMRDFWGLVWPLVRQAEEEKERWRKLCEGAVEERELWRKLCEGAVEERDRARALLAKKGIASNLKREREGTGPSLSTSLSSTIESESQTRRTRPLPRSRSLPLLPSFSGAESRSAPLSRRSTPPQSTPTTLDARLPLLRPKLSIDIGIETEGKEEKEDERELKRRRSCASSFSSSSSSSSITLIDSGNHAPQSPSSSPGSDSDSDPSRSSRPTGPLKQRAGGAKKRSTSRTCGTRSGVVSLPDDSMHVDIMYLPMREALVCQDCQTEIAKAPLSKTRSELLPKSFPATAPWNALREHCVRVHPEACGAASSGDM